MRTIGTGLAEVGFYDGEQVIWPKAAVLPGVTMRLLQQVHDRTFLAPVNVSDLRSMRAAFATNTAVGVRTITAINGVEYPVFDVLCREFGESL